MVLYSSFGRRLALVLWLLGLASFRSQAEPITPLLSPAAQRHLRAQLWRTPAGTARVTMLLQLSNDLVDRHGELDTPLDSAAAYARQAYALSNALHFSTGRIRSLYLLGLLHNFVQPDTLGRPLMRQGIVLSQQQGQRTLEALGWGYLENTYPRIVQNMPRKLFYLQQARALYQQQGAQLENAHLLKAMADIHLMAGQPEQATRELLHVLTLYRAAGHRELHYTYDLLAVATRQLGNYKEAVRYGLATVESAQATHDTASISGFYARVAGLYAELHQDALAMVYYRKALRAYQQTNSPGPIIHTAGDMARALIRQGRPEQALTFFRRTTKGAGAADPVAYSQYLAECYVALRRYPLAERHFTQVVKLVEEGADSDMRKLTAYQAIGEFYLSAKQYTKARWYLQQALTRGRNTGFLLGVANLHQLLFRVDSAQGRFLAAIAHYQHYKLLHDSIFTEAKTKQLASLQIQYDTRKKEQNIALLTKQAQLQQTRLRQREWQRNAGLAGAGMLLLLLGLGYNRYRLKQRSNLLLETQQQEISHKNESLHLLIGEKQELLDDKQRLLEEKEELLQEKDWMLKEIHHRVKNNLQIISSLLNTQADFLHDPAALAALRESQNRVQAMALVHQKLYQSESVALVNMPEYIREITERLLESFDCLDTVREQLDIDPIELDVALATPLGLIINEAITNVLKHAFPSRQPGTLRIGLHLIGPQRYELRIADDGVGLPAGFDPARSQSLGLTMILGLSKQLDGVLCMEPAGPGVQLSLQFEVARKPKRAKGVLA
ncbi:MAG: histidine kinase [Hymenobacter sp.]|nr:MAG: histidine kinase [Hymenobacter sp.]